MTLPLIACQRLEINAPAIVRRGGVTPLTTPRGTVWVKTVEPPRRTMNSMILPTIGMIAPWPILRRSKTGKGGDTLRRQTERIIDLKRLGMPVAEIIYTDRDFLITADSGHTVERAIRYPDIRYQSRFSDETLRSILLQMTRTLAELHRHNTAHGRPKMRDFAWRDGHVTILDLEERPWEVMPMADAQARDAFLWLHDLCSAPFSRRIAPQAAAILCQTMMPETRDSLRRFLRLLDVAAPPARLLLRLMPGNRELTAGIAAQDVLKRAVR